MSVTIRKVFQYMNLPSILYLKVHLSFLTDSPLSLVDLTTVVVLSAVDKVQANLHVLVTRNQS